MIGQFQRCDTGEIIDLEYPQCPACGATGKRCNRPSGHTTADWHVERELLMAEILPCCTWRADEPALFDLEAVAS